MEQSEIEKKGFSLIFKSVKDIAQQTAEEIDRLYFESLQEKDSISGIPTGFIDIDKVTDGLPDGINVLGGRPECGLTDFALNVALNASENYKVTYFTPGIPAEVLMKRLVFMKSLFSPQNIKNKVAVPQRDLPKIGASLEKLADRPINFYDSPLDPETFYEACRSIQDREKKQLIVLDRFQSLFIKRKNFKNKINLSQREISGIFHELADEKGLAILVLSEVKKYEGKISTNYLRDFGILEYIAKPIILFENYGNCDYESDFFREDAVPISVRIANNILGGAITAECHLTYLKSYGRFENASKISTDDIPNED